MWTCQCNNCANGGYYDPPLTEDEQHYVDMVKAKQQLAETEQVSGHTVWPDMDDEIPF